MVSVAPHGVTHPPQRSPRGSQPIRINRAGADRQDEAMRSINAWLFMTLDGVVEAPENWVMPDDEMFAAITEGYAEADALLLGRRTYEIFAASWPERGNDVDNAEWMNTTRKYVASTTLTSPQWQNSSVIEGDVTKAAAELRSQPGKNIIVNGSATLVRSLLDAKLLDELRLFVHPVLVGKGAQLFDAAGAQVELTLADTQPYQNGVVSLTYRGATH
jgi:dihydrofolate reductase